MALTCLVFCNQPVERIPYQEQRTPCSQRDPLRQVYFGDLHVHTSFSFDAQAFDVRVSPEGAYRFAKGEELLLPPLDDKGQGTQRLRLSQKLDFAAVTDHAEFLGEVETCLVPGSQGYESTTCSAYRRGQNTGVLALGTHLGLPDPKRPEDICGQAGERCTAAFGQVWRRIQEAANEAYDRSERCSFTSFVGYEYSGAPGFSTRHRNVLFRSDRVIPPVSYFEEPTPQGLWSRLEERCLHDPSGCDVLAIPHNSNESNGGMFLIESVGAQEVHKEAELRARLEPVAEVYQHKSDSECMNGLLPLPSQLPIQPDELCEFEKHRRTPLKECGATPGMGGVARTGCFSQRDFLRGALLSGLVLEEQVGKNPFQLGFIASTDTHNGTPGAVSEETFIGHRGSDDDTDEKRLGQGQLTQGGTEFSPGGLAAIWAEENTREALFDALRRREVYGTSGPRIVARMFAGWDLDEGICESPELVKQGYSKGVPMGGILTGRPGAKVPVVVVSSARDPQGHKLQLLQIVRGRLRAGQLHLSVHNIAGTQGGATVNLNTCMPEGASGKDTLCGRFVDTEFAPSDRTFYYARVLEVPTCRWSTYACNRLPRESRPQSCSTIGQPGGMPATQQERAWTSPVWVSP